MFEPPKATAEAISADDAVAAARAENGASGATGVAVERQTVTTPDLGRLVDPGDPDSAVIPEYDHQQVWVVAFDVMVQKNGFGGHKSNTSKKNPTSWSPEPWSCS